MLGAAGKLDEGSTASVDVGSALDGVTVLAGKRIRVAERVHLDHGVDIKVVGSRVTHDHVAFCSAPDEQTSGQGL